MNPFQPWNSTFAFWTMMAEAQTVIALRTMGMMGVLPASPRENHTMLTEKGPAFVESAVAAGAAAMAGQDPRPDRSGCDPAHRETDRCQREAADQAEARVLNPALGGAPLACLSGGRSRARIDGALSRAAL